MKNWVRHLSQLQELKVDTVVQSFTQISATISIQPQTPPPLHHLDILICTEYLYIGSLFLLTVFNPEKL